MKYTPVKFVNDEVQISGYVTAKCGSTTLEKWFESLNDISFEPKCNIYNFLQIRNPWKRLVSFYGNKVVDHSFVKVTGNLRHGSESSLKSAGGESLENCSFRELVTAIYNFDKQLEAHLQPQVDHMILTKEKIENFDRIVRLENFKSDMKLVCNDIGIPISSLDNLRKGESKKIKGEFGFVGDWKREKFVEIGGIPKNYDVFIDDDLDKMIRQIYHRDIALLNYSSWNQ